MIRLTAIARKLSPDLRKIVSNTGWLLADKILQMGLALFVGIWVARYLGPRQFGVLNYATSFVGMFSPFVGMGFNSIVVRDIATDPSQKNETLGSTFALNIFGGVLTLVLSVGLISLLEPNEHLTRALVGIIAVATLFQAFDTIDFWFQSQLQSKQVVLSRRTAYVLICAVRVALIQMQAPLIAFAWARLAEVVLIAVGLVLVYRTSGNRLQSWRFSFQRAKDLLKEGFPLILSGFAIYIYAKIDQIMLGTFLTDKSQLGFYSAAVRIAEMFDFLPVILAVSVLPKFSQMKSQGIDYTKKMQIYFDIMIFLWLIVAIPISLLSPMIVSLLYGKSYAPTAIILSLYIWGQFSCNLGMARNSFLTIENKLYYSLYISIFGAVINVVLNLFLIPRYKAVGATISTIITYFIVAIPANYLINDLKPIATFIVRSLNLYRAAFRILELVR